MSGRRRPGNGDSDDEEDQRMAMLRAAAVDGAEILGMKEDPAKPGKDGVNRLGRPKLPSVRDTMFGGDDKDTGSAAAAAAANEEREFQRHASAKLIAFLDQVIEVQERPTDGEKKRKAKATEEEGAGRSVVDVDNASPAGFKLFTKSDAKKPLVERDVRVAQQGVGKDQVTHKAKKRKFGSSEEDQDGGEEDEDGGKRREERLASAAISAEAIIKYANDPQTNSAGDPAKIIPGVRARPKGDGTRPQDGGGSAEQGQKKKKKKKKDQNNPEKET